MPQVVQFAVRATGRSIVTLAAKHVHISERVWRPMSCASPRSGYVIHVAELEEVVTPRLIDVDRALPPNPLTGAQLIFPNVVQEAGRLSTVKTVAKAADKEQIAVGVDPPHRSPTRAGNIRRCRVRCGVGNPLRSVHAVLVGQVGAGNPGPL